MFDNLWNLAIAIIGAIVGAIVSVFFQSYREQIKAKKTNRDNRDSFVSTKYPQLHSPDPSIHSDKPHTTDVKIFTNTDLDSYKIQFPRKEKGLISFISYLGMLLFWLLVISFITLVFLNKLVALINDASKNDLLYDLVSITFLVVWTTLVGSSVMSSILSFNKVIRLSLSKQSLYLDKDGILIRASIGGNIREYYFSTDEVQGFKNVNDTLCFNHGKKDYEVAELTENEVEWLVPILNSIRN